jgi:TonB family protein
VAHAISSTTLRFEHMSPTAAGMALALHGLVAALLLWGTTIKNFEVPEQAIEVTMEEPTPPKAETPPPPPPPPPAAQAQPAPQPTTPPATPPQPPAASDKSANRPLGVPPPGPSKPEPPQEAAAKPEPSPKPAPPPEPAPPAETKLPDVNTPPAPLSMQDFVRAVPPPPPQEIVRPLSHLQPTPPPATVQQQPPPNLKPSPLHNPQPERAPAESQANAVATLVNPAQAAARSRVAEEYVLGVTRKFSQYLPDLRQKNLGGSLVLRLVIARDGRVLDAAIVKSSGIPALDKGMLDTVHAAAPYAPLPSELPGNSFSFALPIESRFAR